MKQYAVIVCLLCSLFNSCQSIEQLSIDYMQPAEISFPNALRKVAVVNNTPMNRTTTPTDYIAGNAQLTTEALAKAIAKGNYFDEVIICDSALRNQPSDTTYLPLSTNKVNELTQQLQADFLIAIENVPFKVQQKVTYDPRFQAYFATIDLKANPTIRVYLPARKGPMATLQSNDSIYWEEIGNSETQAKSRLIPEKEWMAQASQFAGTFPAKQLLPYWTTARRYYFSGGNVAMRDAAVYVRENNWQRAIELWKECYNQSKGKRKMQAAYNLALGYEMQDQLTQALEWARIAQSIAYDIDQVEKKKTAQGIDAAVAANYAATSIYADELTQRAKDIQLLNMQMGRFNIK